MSLIESTENANENTASLQFCTNRLIPEELEAEILAYLRMVKWTSGRRLKRRTADEHENENLNCLILISKSLPWETEKIPTKKR